MAHVEDRGSDSTRLRWRVRWRDPNGRSRSKSFDRKSDAERYRRDVEIRLERGDYLDPSDGRRLFADYAAEWYRGKVAISRKPSALADYRSTLRTHVLPYLGDYPIAAIRYDDVVDLLARLEADGRSASLRRRTIGYTAQVLDEAIRRNAISTNVARLVSLPTLPTRPRHRYLTHRELWDLAAVAEEYETLILFLGYGGVRWGEMAALRVKDLDPLRKVVYVARSASYAGGGGLAYVDPKNHQRRTVPIVDAVLDRLDLDRDPDALLFTSPRGRPLRSSNFHRRWVRYVENSIGGSLTVHELRHTAASLARSAGADVFLVARMLGHKDPSVTAKIYADLFPEELDRLQAMLSASIGDALGTREIGTSRDGEGRVIPIVRGQRLDQVSQQGR